MKAAVTLMIGIVIGVVACENTDEQEFERRLVLEGFVYAGEPVQRIHLWQMHTDGSPRRVPLAGANVHIEQNGHAQELAEHDTLPGTYMQTTTEWVPAEEGTLYLEANFGGSLLKASVEMPPKLTGLSITNEQIILQLFEPGQQVAELSWDALEGWSYCLFLRRRSPNAQLTGFDAEPRSGNPFYEVIEGNSVSLTKEHFKYFGIYDLYVTPVHPEYAAMYTLEPGVHTAFSPEGFNFGFGMLTAFNGSAVTVTVL